MASILYGMPAYDEALERKLKDKSLALGGCVVGHEDPKWRCTRCGKEFSEWNDLRNPGLILDE